MTYDQRLLRYGLACGVLYVVLLALCELASASNC